MKRHQSSLALELAAVLGAFVLAGGPIIAASQSATPEALARQLLDPARTNAERDKLVADSGVDLGALITALVSGVEAGTPEEYVRIPMIWRVALAAGRHNQPDELRRVLMASLPTTGEPLREWQAVVIGGGIVNGISQTGAWPGDRVREILREDAELNGRWQRVPDLAAAMADDEKVKSGTRYDALRIVAVGTWQQRGAQLTRYLASGTPAELQQGAIAALGDMKSVEAGSALARSLKDFTGRSRTIALDALLRDESRMSALLDAVAAGQLTAADLGDARVQKLKAATNASIRARAEQLLR